jgi:hypothetical protein
MSIDAAYRAWLTTLMSVVLMLAPGARAHLHLCFDGSEAPASFHLSDSEMHHDSQATHFETATPGFDAVHSDSDVGVTGDLLSKNKFEWQPLMVLPVVVASLELPTLAATPPEFRARIAPSPPSFLRPPLRGPPSPTSV